MFKPDALNVVVVVFAAALVLQRGTLALLLGLVLLALVVARVWSRLVLRRVTYERTLTPDRAFVGDVVELHARIENPKLLGLPGLRIHDPVSARLDVRGVKLLPHTQANVRLMERWTSLRPYEAVGWRVAIHCQERGYYPFGPVQLEATDPWGLYASSATLPGRTALVVYPRLVPLARLALDPRHPLGEVRAARQLLSDPARTIGVRDYQRGDPFKAIHWSATARTGQFQTRVYEPTTSLEVAIVLDLDTFEHYWEGLDLQLTEWMISAATSVATAAAADRWSLGLYTNGGAADSDELVRLPPSRSPAQLPLVLEALAKLVPYSATPVSSLLRGIGPTLPWGTTVLVIGAVRSDALLNVLLRLAERGRRVLWLYCGSGDLPRIPGVDVRHAAPAETWRPHTDSATTVRPRAGKVVLKPSAGLP